MKTAIQFIIYSFLVVVTFSFSQTNSIEQQQGKIEEDLLGYKTAAALQAKNIIIISEQFDKETLVKYEVFKVEALVQAEILDDTLGLSKNLHY